MDTFQLEDEAQTIEFGNALGQLLKPNDVVLLDGDLGAGKTTLTKGIAQALGIKRYIKSPTYTIIHEYNDGKMPLFHMDAYRLEDGGAEDLGFEDYFNGDGITVVEWSEYIQDFLPDEFLTVHLERNHDNTKRFATVEPHGEHYNQISSELEHKLSGRRSNF